MWHRRRRRRLGVTPKHRKALLRNLVRGLVFNRRIETTLIRAKETARVTDKMVTLAREGTLAARRLLIQRLGSADVAKVLMEQIAPRFKERNGGYTRVLKTRRRPGDGALKAIVEFSVPIEIQAPAREKEKKPKKEKPKEKKVKALAPETPRPVEEKKEAKKEAAKPAKPEEKKETEQRGGFLSKLRKFLTGEEEKK